MFPLYQQTHYYPQPQGGGRGSFPAEEWHRSPYQPRLPSNVYMPVGGAGVNGRLKESSMSPQGSEGSGGSLLSPSPLPPEGPHCGPADSRETGSPVKPAPVDLDAERPDSPKEILDLDSHNAAARHPRRPAPTCRQLPLRPAHRAPGHAAGPAVTSRACRSSSVPWLLNTTSTLGSRPCAWHLQGAPAVSRECDVHAGSCVGEERGSEEEHRGGQSERRNRAISLALAEQPSPQSDFS
ncbi:hypothetical protein SKAU_G00025680 [Synaphobranchus kaupii]|uniref:Uncharacterized protein n=1 Tax=Synaphobranchus kaupii TaxID=118154 RepID=A0A9Q1GE01_SYNKA|nr:hypothetical protein SKAU_G00025680 [Synaphobranchus kaupii]